MANMFVNRIVGYTVKRASELAANPLNWRKHPQRQRDAVQASLRELGWIGAVIENIETGYLLDGHERVWQALSNDEEVPVLQVRLSEAEEKLALAIFDPITYMAETDSEILDELLHEVNTGESALQELLAEMAEDAGLYVDEPAEVQDVAPQVDKAAELQDKWQTATGQLWQLGDHRLICGDCTDPDVVARVMGGEKADMVFTDPPYNIAYNSSENPRWRKDNATIINDKMDAGEWEQFCEKIARLIASVTDGCVYVCHAPGPDGRVMAMSLDRVMHASTTIIWNKDRFTLGRGKYQNKYEPIWFGWVKSGERFTKKRDLANVWDIERPVVSEEHPTMKPVELVVMALEHASRVGDVVFEPFSGSGTTILACEATNRKARAIEISPAYTAVAIDRWATATGKTPVLME